jgi:hypothetical protein
MSRTAFTTKNGLMPFAEIAKALGVSVRTVGNDYKHGIEKLKHIPGAFELILHTIHAVDASQCDLIQCGSAECDKEFLMLYAEDGEQGKCF